MKGLEGKGRDYKEREGIGRKRKVLEGKVLEGKGRYWNERDWK